MEEALTLITLLKSIVGGGLMETQKKARNRFPGALWLLPIFFGILGGIIAALVASLKYNASWWELLVVGIILNIFGIVIWSVYLAALFS